MPESSVDTWTIGTDCKITITGLKSDAGEYINDATVIGVMNDKYNNILRNITFAPVSGTVNGSYEGLLPSATNLADGKEYTLTLTAVKGATKVTMKITRKAAFITL